jgi:type IX secretion system PorP/SprF family membrane protein
MKYNFLNRIKLSCALALSFGLVQAQDPHFTNFYGAPLMLNPALAGLNACDYRIHANFRTQWTPLSSGNTYRTFAGGADFSIGKATKFFSFGGGGISFYSDQAGDVNYSNNRVDLSLAYHFMLNRRGNMSISAGIQGSFNHRGFDPSKATFDSQYDPASGYVNPNGNVESFGRNRVIYGDASLGFLYNVMLPRQNNIWFGVAMFHLNQPKISFFPNNQNELNSVERLYLKTSIHGGALIPFNRRIALQPNMVFLIQGPAYQFNVGANVRIRFSDMPNNSTALFLGLQYRGMLDAMAFLARFEYKGLTLGASYDINISKLSKASLTFGGPEVVLMYQGCMRHKNKQNLCPVL